MTKPHSARPWLRTAAISVVVAALVAGTMTVAWQLALARVPRHRATLERLVQAHTGLDVRFNELGLRWGWYGPEAVFRDVELGEPGGTAVLLRAPELTVGFDAWRTMQTGQLRAGRVTLVAPEIDLVRPRPPSARRRESTQSHLARVLRRWQGGRIDVEAGTLRMPLGSGSVVLRMPRGTIRRSGDTWSAGAQMVLPERLGRSAHVSLSLEGDPERRETLAGTLRFDGRRLAFPGWRELLATYSPHARHVPAAGTGNIELRATLRNGALTRVTGEIAADEVRVTILPAPITIGYLSGKWTAASRPEGWRLDVTDLRAGANGRDATPAALALDVDPTRRRAHALADLVPLELLANAAQALLPNVSLSGLELGGIAQRLEIDWNGNETAGARLQATANAVNVAVAVPSRGFSLVGASARMTATDAELVADLEASAAELAFGGAHAQHWNDVRLAARVLARATKLGWELSTDRLITEHEQGRVSLSGMITKTADAKPRVTVRASVAGASLDALRDVLFASDPDAAPNEELPAIARGLIESGDFEFVGPLGASPAGGGVERFRGSLGIRNASVVGTDIWPSLDDIDAQVTWNGARFSAKVVRGHAAGVQITNAQVGWYADGSGPLQASGRAYGRIEQGLDWLQSHPKLQQIARNAHQIQARGDGVLDFAVTVPTDAADEPKVRLALSLEGARVHPARAIPAIDGLRGTLVLQDGRLRRTTLTGKWLGGPVSLRVDEHRGRPGEPVTELHAQGLFDAAFAARAAGLDGAERLSGSTAWQGTFAISSTEAGASIVGHAETNLEGIASELPAPLSKAQAAQLPLRIEIDARGAQPPELRLMAHRLRGTFALALAEEGWRIERGSLRIGAGEAMLPMTASLVLAGRVARLELPEWLAIGRLSARDETRPPLWAELVADELDIAGRTFADVELTAREDDAGLHVRAESAALAGSLQVPREPGSRQPIEVALARLDIPSPGAGTTVAGLVASLAPAARLSAEEVTWQGRQLGRLHAELSSNEERVRIDSLRLAGVAHDLDGVAHCEASLDTCRFELEVTSGDAGQMLRDFGFADDIDAQRARLTAALDWQRQPDRTWLASVTGHVGLILERGRVQAAQPGAATPFALFAIPALLLEEGPSDPNVAADAATGLAFRRLEGDYTLRDGHAVTSNLHLDGEAEILARGRVGLVDRDYDQVAWVLEGEERLPSAVRRFGATPRVAAAWLQLRDFFGGPEVEDSRAVLHLHGSWMRPIVGAPVQEEATR